MFTNNKTIFYPFLVMLLISILGSSASADIPDGHKPIPCIGCHQETLGAGIGYGECGDCHKYTFSSGGINVKLMEEKHNPKICTGCHIGNTLASGNKNGAFHNAHNSVKCTLCHLSETNTVLIIKEGTGFNCVGCHGNAIHSIHISNLSRVCSTCHGSWAAGKKYTPESDETLIKNAGLERFTILNFIMNSPIVKLLLGQL